MYFLFQLESAWSLHHIPDEYQQRCWIFFFFFYFFYMRNLLNPCFTHSDEIVLYFCNCFVAFTVII